ncbi:MAG: Trk system potassium transporter TrkA, partial [Candidatus Dadabacteria bacterium]
IEQNPDTEQILSDRVNALVVHGSGASAEVLREANAADADLFIAVTDQDEVNLVSCIIARQLGARQIIARVKSGHFESGQFDASALGIDLIINPESVVAEEIAEVLRYTEATDAAEFADGKVVFVGYPITEDSDLAGLAIRDIGLIGPLYPFVVVAITRGDETVVPRGDDVLQAGDVAYIVCKKSDLARIAPLFGIGRAENGSQRVFVLGGSRIGRNLTELLARRGFRVTIVDRDPDIAQALAREFDEPVRVLNTRGTDMDTLRSEGLGKAEAFIAVTHDERSNILCSLLAKKHGADRAIALVDGQEYLHLSPQLGVDASISPRLATASAILKYVRRGDVADVAVVEQANAEVLEFVVHEDSPHLGQPLRNLALPRGVNLGAIIREKDVIIPKGDTELAAEDHIIVFALPDAIGDVEDFFAASGA